MAKKASERKKRRHKKARPFARPVSQSAPKPKKQKKGSVFVDSCELPVRYARTGVTLIARDPYAVYAYWEITPSSLSEAQKKLGSSFKKSKRTLRIYDVTDIDFNKANARHRFDIDIDSKAQSRYIVLPDDNVTLCADLGFRTPSGVFYPLARSNVISTPCANVSDRSEITWAKVHHKEGSKPSVVAQTFAPFPKGRKAVHGSKEPVRTGDRGNQMVMASVPENAPGITMESMRADDRGNEPARASNADNIHGINPPHELTESGNPSSFIVNPAGEEETTFFSADIANVSSETVQGGASEQLQRQRDFFFQLDAELIVYGRTEPGARVTMDGCAIDCREDGTFSQRLAFPDGLLPLDFCARSADGREKKAITLLLARTTILHH